MGTAIDAVRNQPLGPERRRHGYDTLTSRERTVLQMVAEGLSSKEVAGRLAVSAKTVEYHRGQLMQKLGVHEVAGLTRFAVRHGLVSIE